MSPDDLNTVSLNHMPLPSIMAYRDTAIDEPRLALISKTARATTVPRMESSRKSNVFVEFVIHVLIPTGRIVILRYGVGILSLRIRSGHRITFKTKCSMSLYISVGATAMFLPPSDIDQPPRHCRQGE